MDNYMTGIDIGWRKATDANRADSPGESKGDEANKGRDEEDD